MNNTNNYYNTIEFGDVNYYNTIEFGDVIKMDLPKTMTSDEIYERIEAAISILVGGCFIRLIKEMDSESKNNFINHWTTSSKNKKIKDTMMVVFNKAMKIDKFKTNSVKCNNMFKKFCNESFGYFKKHFKFYSDLVKQQIAA